MVSSMSKLICALSDAPVAMRVERPRSLPSPAQRYRIRAPSELNDCQSRHGGKAWIRGTESEAACLKSRLAQVSFPPSGSRTCTHLKTSLPPAVRSSSFPSALCPSAGPSSRPHKLPNQTPQTRSSKAACPSLLLVCGGILLRRACRKRGARAQARPCEGGSVRSAVDKAGRDDVQPAERHDPL